MVPVGVLYLWGLISHINPILDIDKYPLPKPSELFTSLSGEEMFSKLDITRLLTDDQSKKLVTINTHRRLYRYTYIDFHLGLSWLQGFFNRPWISYFKEFHTLFAT